MVTKTFFPDAVNSACVFFLSTTRKILKKNAEKINELLHTNLKNLHNYYHQLLANQGTGKVRKG